MTRIIILVFLLLSVFSSVFAPAADNIIVDSHRGKSFFKDNLGNLYPLWISYQTDGSGNLKLINSSNPVDDTIALSSGKMYLKAGNGNTYPAMVLYSTDGNGNLIPIPAGGGGGGSVTAVTASSPLFSSGGTAPNITAQVANGSQNGYLASSDWTTFNGKQAAGNYITALTGDVVATGPGSVASTIQPLAVTNAKIANTTIDLTAKVTNVLPAANGGAPPTTRFLWVDNQRGDTYTADGSFARPFKTIGAAITQIITNNDNSTHAYTINVNPGAYTETITLSNAALYNLTFTSFGAAPSTGQTVSITGISSTANNTNLANLIVNGFTMNTVNLTGDINNTNFGSTQILFVGCDFEIGGGGVTWENVNNVSVYGGQFNGSGTVLVENTAFGYVANVEGFHAGATVTLVQNNAGNQPSQSSGNYLLLSNTKNYATTSIDAGSELDSLVSYWGTGSSVVNNGTIHSWNTQWNGTLTLNNGSLTRLQGDNLLNNPTINAGATLNSRGWFYGSGATFGSTAVAAANADIVYKDGHVKSTQTTAPTTTLSANAGSGGSPSCTVSHAVDDAGNIVLVTGTSAWASGTQCTVNFNHGYNVAPICVATPSNPNAASKSVSQQINFTTSTSALTISFGAADTAQTTYNWQFKCVETQ